MPEVEAETTVPTPADVKPQGQPAQAQPAVEKKQEPETEIDWKVEARKWEERAKAHNTELEAARPKLSEYDKLVEASQSDLDKATSRAEKAEQAVQGANLRAVKAEVRANAGDFVHSDVPFAFLPDLTKYVTDDGIDTAALKADLATVLTDNPALGKPAGTRAPAPSPAVGSSALGTPSLDDQIAAAKKAGDFRQAIHLENQKLAPQTRA